MPTQVTFHTEASREAFRVLRDELNTLLGESMSAPSPSGGPPQDTAHPASLRQVAEELSGINPNLRQLVRFMVDHYPDTAFTWDDVARDMGRELKTVKSWHRSLSKQLNRIARRHPSAPRILSQRWDGSRNHYKVDEGWREAIQQEWLIGTGSSR